MARPYEGDFSLISHKTKGIATKKGGELTAEMALETAEKAVKAATSAKVGLDRWSFYVQGESEKLGDTDKFLKTAVVSKAIEDGYDLTIEAAKWGHPRVTLRPKGSKRATKAKSYTVVA